MKSTFAPSFLAAYNAALAILRVVREHLEVIPHVMLRYWSAWTHSLNASVSFNIFLKKFIEVLITADDR